MTRALNAAVLSLLAMSITTVVVGVEEEGRAECADLNKTTWQKFRQHRARLQVQYLLLTRGNPDCATYLSLDNLSPYNSSLPTKVIIHGYRAVGSKPSWVRGLAHSLLQAEDVNVVVVDWMYGASFAYNLAVENYKEVALRISILINQLHQNQGCKFQSFHFIGVSLGAHVAGFVGTIFEGKIGRITGLDPAGPMFKTADKEDRLDPSDAQFVEAIHTDSDYFGISIPVGHVDFFLNGGMDQVGCTPSRLASLYGYMICDHMRALHVYISMLNGSRPLMGIPCSSYEDFLEGQCLTCDGVFNGTCPTIGLSENSGITVSPLPKEQKLYLITTSEPPYRAQHFLLELRVSPLEKRATLEVTLKSKNASTEHNLPLRTEALVYRRVLAHPSALCEIGSIQLRSTGARFYRQGDFHVHSVCISPFPTSRPEEPLCVNNINVWRGTPWSHDYVQLCDYF